MVFLALIQTKKCVSNFSVLFVPFSDQMSRSFSLGPALGSSTVKDIGTIPYLESDSLNEKFRLFNPEKLGSGGVTSTGSSDDSGGLDEEGDEDDDSSSDSDSDSSSSDSDSDSDSDDDSDSDSDPDNVFKGEGYGTARKQQEVKEARQKIATAALRHLHDLGWTREALAAGMSLIRQLIDRSID